MMAAQHLIAQLRVSRMRERVVRNEGTLPQKNEWVFEAVQSKPCPKVYVVLICALNRNR